MANQTESALATSQWPLVGGPGPAAKTIGELLSIAAESHPTALALVDATTGRRWSYTELDHAVDVVACRLAARFDSGERVAIWSPNCVEYVVAFLAMARRGLISVPLNPAFREAEVLYALRQSRSSGLVRAESSRGVDLGAIYAAVSRELPDVREELLLSDLVSGTTDAADDDGFVSAAQPEDPVMILYTSGTTGAPKGAVLSHQSVVHVQRNAVRNADMQPGEVWLDVMPMFHIGGLCHGAVATLLYAGTHVVLDRFRPQDVLRAIESHRVSSTLMVPTMIVDTLDHPDASTTDLSSLRSILVGGAPTSVQLARRVDRELQVPLFNLFGQTETSGPIAQTRAGDSLKDRTETVGYPQPHVEVRIVDPVTADVVPIGHVGEIQVRGRQTLIEYWDAPDQTAETLLVDGWLRMGDVGSMDARGYLTVTSRLKDMIIRGGENIYPREIEDVLAAHADVLQVSVVGVPDERWGEQVAAFIVPRENVVDVDVLWALCRESLAPHKAPSQWFVVPNLPTTPSGKIRKVEIVENVVAGSYGQPASYSRSTRHA